MTHLKIPALLIVILSLPKVGATYGESLSTARTDGPFIYLLMVVGSLIYASGELMELCFAGENQSVRTWKALEEKLLPMPL